VLAGLAVGGHGLFSLLNAPVEVVRVEGDLPEAGQARLREVLGAALPSGIFTLDVGALQARLAAESWVASASLRREWPDTLRVTVEPEVPVARWRDEALLSNRGRIIAPLWDNAPGTLPSLSGPEGSAPQLMATYLRVAEMLQGHQLTVARVEESAAGDIEVTLQGGVRLRLGTDAQVARLRRVDAVLSAALAAQLDRVDSIDARFDNGVAVSWREGAAGDRSVALRVQRLGKGR
jgi:cell division protein FtsQ